MNCSPTLTAEEFSNVHNAKCQLHSVLQDINGIVHPRIEQRLQEAIALLDSGLASAYDQDEAAAAKSSAHFDEVSEKLGVKSIWSMYEVSDMYAPHPWPHHKILAYSDHWGDGEVKVYIDGPTWADLWVAADRAIKASGDGHHIFIEDFTQSKTRDFELCLSTGS